MKAKKKSCQCSCCNGFEDDRPTHDWCDFKKPRRPGPGCSKCDMLEGCPEGKKYLAVKKERGK